MELVSEMFIGCVWVGLAGWLVGWLVGLRRINFFQVI